MNLLDSHDTERLLWTLTPGADNRADREQNAANVAAGKERQRLAALIQFTLPGAPTVYYGDEVGMTGDDDPDDRRTYPWADPGGTPDQTPARPLPAPERLLRELVPVAPRTATCGSCSPTTPTASLAYGRKTRAHGGGRRASTAASSAQTLDVPVAGYLPDGRPSQYRVGGSGTTAVAAARCDVTLGADVAASCSRPLADLTPPAAPGRAARASEGDGPVALSWNAVARRSSATTSTAARSRGGGYVRRNGAAHGDDASPSPACATPSASYYFVVRALDAPGNESADSERGQRPAAPHDRLGEPAVAADADPHDQRGRPRPTTSTARSGSTA